MLSPKMEKTILSPRSQAIKREHETKELHKKRAKFDESVSNDTNFIIACEQVSKKVNEDKLNRFHLPSCLRSCRENNFEKLEKINEMLPHAEETFKIEMRSNKWYEALEVSMLSITPTQYLSESVLKNIVEIMLNAHEDPLSEYHMTHLIDKCQQVLSLNIRMHPPCTKLWKYYDKFLTSPMDLRNKTLTNRNIYGSQSGILKYCINRLENELNSNCTDGPFFNKEEEIPEIVQQKIQEMHWVKSRLEIYEMLNRTDRIDRLMAVLDSLTELLGFDLAIWQSRQVNQLHRSNRNQKLLMMQLLSNTTNQSTDAENDMCLQIMKIFVYIVHLNYPEKYIKTMSLWINILEETLYINGKPEQDVISDFYKPGKACTVLADKFYKIIVDLPPESIIKILERITPARLQYSIGILHARKLLSYTDEDNIIKILINFMLNCQWNQFPETTTEIKSKAKRNTKSITSDNILKQLTMICKNHNKACSNDNNVVYLKFETGASDFVNDRNYVMKILYITFQAYLDTYKVHRFQKTLLQLNNELNENKLQDSKELVINKNPYRAIIDFINLYRDIYMDLKYYFNIIKSLKCKNDLPDIFYVFENIIDLNEL